MNSSGNAKKQLTVFQKKLLQELIAIIIGIVIAIIPPPAGLSPQAMWVLALLAWGMANWIMQPIPNFVTMLIMCCLWVVFGILPFGKAFGNFAGTTVWLLVGAFSIGVAVSKSGLLRRMALYILKLFKPNYNGMLLAFLCSGAVLGPTIPSTIAKCSIISPISVGIGRQLGFAERSNGMGGLFSASYTGYSLLAPLFISSSVFGYTILGLMPPEVQAQFTFGNWFVSMIPWGLITIVLSYFGLKKVYKPEANVNIITKEDVKAQLKELGPMTKNEKIVSVIVVCCIALWIMEKLVGIPAIITTVLGACAMISFGVLDVKDYETKISWSLITFVGGVIGIATALDSVGFIAWIGTTFGGYMSGIVQNPYIFIAVGLVIMYVLRLVIPDHTAAFTSFIVVMMPFCLANGVNPWIAGIIGYVGCQPYILYYQNMNFVPIFQAAGGEEAIGYKNARRWSIPISIITAIALLASVPFWQLIGIL